MDNREPERKPRSFGIRELLFAIVLAVILLLLGQSMVRHRFFQGGRGHQNGSLSHQSPTVASLRRARLVQFSAAGILKFAHVVRYRGEPLRIDHWGPRWCDAYHVKPAGKLFSIVSMNAITEDGGDWMPGPGECFRGCVNPWIGELHITLQGYDHCGQCSDVPYRVVVIESKQG